MRIPWNGIGGRIRAGILSVGACACLTAAYLWSGAALSRASGLDAASATLVWDIAVAAVCTVSLFAFGGGGAFERRDRASSGIDAPFVAAAAAVWFAGQVGGSWCYASFGDAAFDSYTAVQQSNAVSMAAVSFLGAPVSEELFFRGVLASVCRGPLGAIGSALVSTALFAASHGTLVHVMPTVACGLVSYAAWERGGFKAALWAHLASNIGAALITGVQLPSWAEGPALFVPLFAVPSIWLLAGLSSHREEERAIIGSDGGPSEGWVPQEVPAEDTEVGMAKLDFKRLVRTVFDEQGRVRDCGDDAKKLLLRYLYDELEVEDGSFGDPETGELAEEAAWDASMYILTFEE